MSAETDNIQNIINEKQKQINSLSIENEKLMVAIENLEIIKNTIYNKKNEFETILSKQRNIISELDHVEFSSQAAKCRDALNELYDSSFSSIVNNNFDDYLHNVENALYRACDKVAFNNSSISDTTNIIRDYEKALNEQKKKGNENTGRNNE